jgi:hypothetical protein
MTSTRSGLLGCAALVLATAGCGSTVGSPPQFPDQTESARCPETLPDRSDMKVDDGSGRELVPTTSQPVRLTLCVYELGGRASTATSAWEGGDLDAAVAELNAFPAFVHAEDHVCNAAMWPGYLLLVDHRDGAVTTLTVDRSCGLVADGAGAVRLGVPEVVAVL